MSNPDSRVDPGSAAVEGGAQCLVVTQPDDWHVHLRDGAMLRQVVGATARQFARALVMPNLKPPVETVAQALEYRARILRAAPTESVFEPIMALYLTRATTVSEIELAARTPAVRAVKFYPAGATTHSEAGLQAQDLIRSHSVLRALAETGLPLLIHGEVTDPDVDVFDRERVFIERHLRGLVDTYPNLKIVLEHVTTAEGVRFVQEAGPQVAATLTPQHLLYNRNALFQGGLRPHHYCLPVLKREHHREALCQAAISGSPKFFLGSDSAPHSRAAKEAAWGCAGCYSAPLALELYAAVFARLGVLARLEGFASHYGADFYGLPRNRRQVRLVQERWVVPESYPAGEDTILVPLGAGTTLPWRLEV